jgi:glycosyltransferase involved in cell wall biosynthesis
VSLPELRIRAFFRHPTPYRDPLLDRVAALPGIRLDVEYLGRTFAQTPWAAEPLRHAHRFPRRFLERQVGDHDVAVHPGALARLVTDRPDACVLSAWSDPTIILAAWVLRAMSIPYLLVNESFLESGRSGVTPRVRRAVRSSVVRGASAWLPTGSRARDWGVSLGADPARCRFFPTSPDARRWIEHVDRLRREEPGLRGRLGVPADDVVAFVGRVVRDKAPEVLLDAFALLRERRPAARLVIVGDGPLRAGLEKHRAAPWTTFAGFLQPPDVARVLASCDLLVLPSRHETWGAVVTEALAAGVPVVVSEDVGCAPDLVGESGPGSIVPVDDAPALAAAMEGWLARTDRRGALPAIARARAVEWGHDLNVRSLALALRDAGLPVAPETLSAAGASLGPREG